MQTLKIDRSHYTLSPTRDAGAFAEKLRKCTGKTKLSPIKSERRVYPKFSAGDSTAEYVHRYWVANGFSDDHRKFFAPLNTEPATLYSGEDTHETVDDFELCAPVESIETAPVDIAQPEPAAVESAPDAPMDPAAVDRAPDAPIEPAPVEAWPPLQPMMRPAEHIARLPLFARLAIERIDADSDLRTGAKLDELLRAYAAQYRETCDDYTRQSAHAIASRRFWNFRPDDAPTEPAAIVPAADPAPAAPRAPVDGDRFFIREWQPGTAHSWRSAAPSDAPRDYLVRQAIIAGYIGGAHRWAECAKTGAFLYGIGADTRPIHAAPVCPDPAPVDPAPAEAEDSHADAVRSIVELVDVISAESEDPDAWYPRRQKALYAYRATHPAAWREAWAKINSAPRADPAPVDTGAAELVESAPTPGYAFPAHALPATHSDAAEPAPADRMAAAKFARQSAILEKLIRCDGQVMTRRAFLHSKIRDGLRLTVEQHDRIAPMSRMATFRASNEEQRAHDRRILAAGKKDVYFIGGFEVTKIEHDYANEVLASMAPAADPAPVPVPVNSADVDAVEIARLVAKFRQFADERRRTGDTLAAAIRVESAEARYRADNLTAPNAFRDAPGAGHEAAKAHDTRRAAEYRAAAAELDRLADAMPADDAAPVATHSAPIAEPVDLATHSASVDDGGFSRRVDTAAAYISGGRRTSRTFDSCFEMWDGDAVAVALLRRAEKRPGTRLAANLSRYLARHHVEAAADRQPTGLSLAEWSRALIKAREPLPETAPVPADTAPDDDTTPAPLDGLDVIETADAETLAEFDRLSRAPGVAPTATDARPIPSGPVLRIPAGDLRARIPARFAPAYLLTAGGAHHA